MDRSQRTAIVIIAGIGRWSTRGQYVKQDATDHYQYSAMTRVGICTDTASAVPNRWYKRARPALYYEPVYRIEPSSSSQLAVVQPNQSVPEEDVRRQYRTAHRPCVGSTGQRIGRA
eukprot:3931947-Rhodomonas_salina.3